MIGISTNSILLGNQTLQASGNNLLLDGDNIIPITNFSKSTVLYNPVGIDNLIYNFPIWRAISGCTATGIHGIMVSGSQCSISARKNFSMDLLASDIIISQTGLWNSSGIIQNSSFIQGDTLEARVTSTSGSPISISIQIDFIN